MVNQLTITIKNSSCWKMRMNMERNLTLIFVGILIASSFLAIESVPSISTKKDGLIGKILGRVFLQFQKNKHHDICLTPGCVKAAASVINNMDTSVDPCDDFYQFACGNFIKTTFIDEEKSTYGEIADLVLNNLQMILSEPIQPNEQKPFKMMKLQFKSCMDQEKTEKQGYGSIKTILKSLGGWPVLEAEKWNDAYFTWKDIVYKFREAGLSVDYFIRFSIDYKNSTTRAIALSQATLGLDQEFLVNGPENHIVAAYYNHMVDDAVLFGADRKWAAKELRDSLDFEIELAKISQLQSVDRNRTELYDTMNIADLQQHFPSIPWQEYINKLLFPLAVRQDDMIIVKSSEYLSGLERLISKTPKRVQANYLFGRAVRASVIYVSQELKRIHLENSTELSGRTEREPRWKECLSISSKYFPLAIGSLYIRRLFAKNDKTYASEMVNGIREEMYKIIEASDWMDDKTRKNMMDKAKSITNHIAFPDELLDDSKLNAYYDNLEVNDTDSLTLWLNFNKFETDHIFSQLRQPVNKSDWITHSQTTLVNAKYLFLENSILVPAGFLQGALFSSDRPRYMNYGGIGFVIGHEITHGFDDRSQYYDKNGNIVDWWGKNTKKRFMEKASCLIQQYGNYTAQEVGLKLNGINTLSENIADNGGAKQAYYAYKVWAKQNGREPRLPGLQKYTPKQMFWLSVANVWCSKFKPETLKNLIKNEVHTIDRFRIIGTFSNLKEFSSDFRCPLGSNMNPVNKCQVW